MRVSCSMRRVSRRAARSPRRFRRRGNPHRSAAGDCTPSCSACWMITELSHSPSDMPDRRAASFGGFAGFRPDPFHTPRDAKFHCSHPRSRWRRRSLMGSPWNRHTLTAGGYGRGPQSSARLFAGHGKQAVNDWAEVPDFACGFGRRGGRRRLNAAVSRMRDACSPRACGAWRKPPPFLNWSQPFNS